MRLKSFLTLTTAAALLAFAGCSAQDQSARSGAAQPTFPQEVVLGSFGVALDNIDNNVHPGDDFYRYVNGTWLRNTQIPDDKSNYGSFNILADQAELRVREIIEGSSETRAAAGSAEQKIGDLYNAFMDEAAIQANGLAPIQDDLDAISALSTHAEIAAALGDPTRLLTAPFGYYVYIDSKAPDTYITQMVQTGLGMPDRDFYLDDDEASQNLRAAYLAYVSTLMSEAGFDAPERRAQDIIDFETRLAQVHWTRVKRRDRDLAYNKMSLDAFKAYAPGFNWQAMLDASGLGGIDAMIIRQDSAIKDSAEIFAGTPVSVLQDYIRFHFISDMSGYLPDAYGKANFAFYDTAVRGTEVQRERWKRGVSLVSNYLGEAIGQVYVTQHFPHSSKAQMLTLVENLRATFKDGINNLDWMDAQTKIEAQDKLAKFNPKIGYPDVWKDYSNLNITSGTLIENVRNAMVWEIKDNFAKLGQPIDRDEWGITPQTVNAYYNSALNEIVFPAAILDAPFFDPHADIAVNYGGIGAVIGHEMGHGFDDQGRKTDGNGELRDWWTADDAQRFKERANTLVDQYSMFEPLPGVNLNGELTLGENIGDLTGVTMAYAAYKRALGGQEAPVINGFTGDQRFFLAYGQIWARKFRDEALLSSAKTSVHSPGEFRTNGIVRNFGPWYDAFDVQPGDALYIPPEARVSIW